MSLLKADLPAAWQWARVGDFYEVTRKPRGLDVASLGELPFLPMEAIPQGGEFSSRYAQKAVATISSGTYFERGDILVAKITPSFENGKQALAEDVPASFGFASTEVIPLRPSRPAQDRRFLFYYLLHPEVRSFVAEKMEGTTGRQRVPENVLLDLPFPHMGMADQRGIADALTAVRSAIKLEKLAHEKGKELKKATVHELFMHGLRGEAQKETKVGLVPESWALIPAGQIFKLTSGKTRPDDLSPVATSEKPFAVLGGNGVMGYSSKWNWDSDAILVIGRVGEYCGAIHVVSGKVWITDNALYAREWLNPDVIVEFAAAYLEYFDLNRFKRMAGQPLVTQGMINEHSLPVPVLDEQRKMVTILGAIDCKIDLHKRKKVVLEELFTALLHKLLTGKIRIADLDLSALADVTKGAEAAA